MPLERKARTMARREFRPKRSRFPRPWTGRLNISLLTTRKGLPMGARKKLRRLNYRRRHFLEAVQRGEFACSRYHRMELSNSPGRIIVRAPHWL